MGTEARAEEQMDCEKTQGRARRRGDGSVRHLEGAAASRAYTSVKAHRIVYFKQAQFIAHKSR